MNIPLSLSDVGLWLAGTAIILLVTSELLYSVPGFANKIKINRFRLRLAAVGCGVAFLITIVLRLLFQPI